MDFGNKIVQLRKNKSFSRDELGKTVGTSGAIIGRYERNEITPSVDMASKIADALNVSLDYLVGNTDTVLERDLLKKITDIQNLPEDKKNVVMTLIDTFLKQTKLQNIM